MCYRWLKNSHLYLNSLLRCNFVCYNQLLISINGTIILYPHGRDSPDVIGPQGNLQLSQDLCGFLDPSPKLIKHIQGENEVKKILKDILLYSL